MSSFGNCHAHACSTSHHIFSSHPKTVKAMRMALALLAAAVGHVKGGVEAHIINAAEFVQFSPAR